MVSENRRSLLRKIGAGAAISMGSAEASTDNSREKDVERIVPDFSFINVSGEGLEYTISIHSSDGKKHRDEYRNSDSLDDGDDIKRSNVFEREPHRKYHAELEIKGANPKGGSHVNASSQTIGAKGNYGFRAKYSQNNRLQLDEIHADIFKIPES